MQPGRTAAASHPTLASRPRKQATSLLREIEQDRIAFPNGLPGIGIDNDRNLGVRIQRGESVGVLRALPDVHDLRFVVETEFFQRDCNLMGGGRSVSVKSNHAFPLMAAR